MATRLSSSDHRGQAMTNVACSDLTLGQQREQSFRRNESSEAEPELLVDLLAGRGDGGLVPTDPTAF